MASPAGVSSPADVSSAPGSPVSGRPTPALQQQLREAEALLARFTNANSALVNENDRLRGSRDVIRRDYAVLLDEIEGLHKKMGVLEAMVKQGRWGIDG